jgi:hypothetical protein
MISEQTPRKYYTGDGSTLIFAVPFEFFRVQDLVVYLTDTTTTPETDTLQVLDTDYLTSGGAGTGADPASGSIAFLTAPAAGKRVSIYLDPLKSQDAEFVDNDPFPASTLNAQLDKIVLMAQVLFNERSRSLGIAETETQSSIGRLPKKADRASNFLAFDSNADPIASAGVVPGSIPVSAFMETVLDDTTAAAARTTMGGLATLAGSETLTNKTITAPTVTSPTISGTVGGSATYTTPILTTPQVNGLKIAAAAKTAAYTLTATDDFITCDSDSGAFTVTLPDCATNAGKVFKIKKVGTTFDTAKAVTIARAGSDTIFTTVASATSTTLNTPGEEIEIVSLGSTVWQVMSRRIPSGWIAYTPTTGLSNTSTPVGFWRRVGDSIQVTASIQLTGAGTGNVTCSLPSGLTIDTSRLAGTTAASTAIGSAFVKDSGTAFYNGVVVYDVGLTAIRGYGYNAGNGFGTGVPITWASGDEISYSFTCPITGWNG